MTAVEDRVAFPVAAGTHVVGRLERCRVAAQQLIDLLIGPDIELALDSFAVGVEGAGEAALRGDHVAQHPVGGLHGAAFEQWRAGLLPQLGQKFEELGVVVEHLFEVGHQPALIHRVSREAAAEMVVDATLAHAIGGVEHGGAQFVATAPAPGPPQELEGHGLGKLGGVAEAAMGRVDLGQQALGDLVAVR